MTSLLILRGAGGLRELEGSEDYESVSLPPGLEARGLGRFYVEFAFVNERGISKEMHGYSKR